MKKGKKVAIVGAGSVGATAAYTLAMNAMCSEIVLYDIDTDIAIGKAIDIEQSTAYSTSGTKVWGAKHPSELENCHIVVITAGVPRQKGMTREDLLTINAKIMEDVIGNIKAYSPNAFIICVANPLDVMTYVCHKMTGWESNRIVGMAGALDSARMSYQINNLLGFGQTQIKSMVIGDHGENMIPCPTLSSIGGVPLEELISKEDMEKIIDRTKNGGAQIVKHLGTSAYYAPGRAVAYMVEAMIKDAKIVIPSSVLLNGEYGHFDVTVGVPAIIGANGVEKVIELNLDDDLKTKFDISVQTIRNGIKVLEENNFFK